MGGPPRARDDGVVRCGAGEAGTGLPGGNLEHATLAGRMSQVVDLFLYVFRLRFGRSVILEIRNGPSCKVASIFTSSTIGSVKTIFNASIRILTASQVAFGLITALKGLSNVFNGLVY